MIQICCPKCQSLLVFENSSAGRVVACPDCDGDLQVPSSSDVDWPSAKGDAPIDLETADIALTPEDAEVLAELDRLQNRKPGWLGTSALLVISLLLYLGAARAQKIWDSILILIPVLLFHEAGHYVAMRLFGYRNLQMFFIPFFGAAVSGRHYNIAGWKKALVALAGPVPGILLGSIAGVVGLNIGNRTVVDVGMYMLILNGFNLLPFLPLDGGWVVHAVLFVRHPVLDVVFRVLAALAMFGLAYLASSWLMGVIGFFMLFATPTAFRLARIAHRLKAEGLTARSVDNNSIPNEAALQILAELRRSLSGQTPPSALAQYITNVFEMFNAEPPGIPVSIVLLLVHAGSFIVALAMTIFIFVKQNGW